MVTWPMSEGTENAACLRCGIEILEAVTAAAPRFRSRFGVAPRLRIGLHAGEVVAGELVGLKREIVFSGDTVNTAARIQAEANRRGEAFVVSGDLLDRLAVPGGIRVRPLGPTHLKGRAAALDLFAVGPRPTVT